MLSNKNQRYRCRGCSKFVATLIAPYNKILIWKAKQKVFLVPETMIGQPQLDMTDEIKNKGLCAVKFLDSGLRSYFCVATSLFYYQLRNEAGRGEYLIHKG